MALFAGLHGHAQSHEFVFQSTDAVRVSFDFTIEYHVAPKCLKYHRRNDVPKHLRKAIPDKYKYPTRGGLAFSASVTTHYNALVDNQDNHDLGRYHFLYTTGIRFSNGTTPLGQSGNKEHLLRQFEWLNGLHALWSSKKEYAPRQFQYFTANHGYSATIQHKNWIGTGIIFVTNPRRETQRSGSFNLGLADFTLFYTNDGGPYHNLGLGDQWDRYWNGGLSLNFGNLDRDMMYHFGFDKFTGFRKNSYMAGSGIGLDVVEYEREYEFNKGIWRFRAIDNTRGFWAQVGLASDDLFDFQNFLHILIDEPLHGNYANPGFEFGAAWSNRYRTPNQYHIE